MSGPAPAPDEHRWNLSSWALQHQALTRSIRRPLLAECHRRAVPLADMVTHVLVHEVGHHFGLSDEDMRILEEEP